MNENCNKIKFSIGVIWTQTQYIQLILESAMYLSGFFPPYFLHLKYLILKYNISLTCMATVLLHLF